MEPKLPHFKKIFKLNNGTSTMVLPNATTCHFINGKYATDIKSEIEYFMNEIENHHPHLYIDEKESEIDVNLDPQAAIKAAGVAEYIAAQEAARKKAIDPKNDMGNSNQSGGQGTGIAHTGTSVNTAGTATAKLASLSTSKP